MKTTKWILACVLAASMTAATIWAQKDAAKDAHQDIIKHSEEIEQLVDIAELDLLTDMIESLLREEENDDSKSFANSQIPENSLVFMPGIEFSTFGVGFCGFTVMAGLGTMNGFGEMGMGGFGGMGGFYGF